MLLSEADHAAVTAAVTAAERGTDGEIVTIVAGTSDRYHDVALHWSLLAAALMLAVLAAWPGIATDIHHRFAGDWSAAPTPGIVLTIALVLTTATFLAARAALAWMPLRIALTPPATRTRRVRARAMLLFRTGTEQRTTCATGVLLYLSLAEHRAELIADAAIHGRVPPDVWGHAMASLVRDVRDGRPADGMAAAVGEIGVVLAEHFPAEPSDRNQLPDRLIEV